MRKVKTTKKSSKKAVKKTINQLTHQNIKELSKHCTDKFFNNIESADKLLTDLFLNKKVQQGMKDKVLDTIKCGLTESGTMEIELVFNNDKTLAAQCDEVNKKITSFLDELIAKMKK